MRKRTIRFVRSAVAAVSLALTLNACAHAHRSVIVLAFPHGGDAGADGIRADAAATAALRERGYDVEHIDLDAGVQNPHQDEGTDDQRAAANAAALPKLLRERPNVGGLIVGPTRRIADAVPWRALRVPVVAVAPLVRDIPCTCRNESQLRRSDAAVVIEAPDGSSWIDARGSRFANLRDAVDGRAVFDIVNREGVAYHVPARSRAALLASPDSIDRRGFSSSAFGLAPIAPFVSPERLAVQAVDEVL